MKGQAFLGRHLLGAGRGVVAVDLPQGLEHVAAWLGKARRHLHELAPGMRNAVGDDRLELPGRVVREGVTHLDRRRQRGRPFGEHPGQILAGVLSAGEVQSDVVLSHP